LRNDDFELGYNKSDETWTAKKNGFHFLADNPIELQGLTAIYAKLNPNEQKEYWWQINEPEILRELDPE
jgi:hypothetical protein